VSEIIVGVDIGTTKVCTVIGRIVEGDRLEILGEGMSPCNSVKKGVIVDIDKTAESIRDSVNKAEDDAGVKVFSVYVNIIGLHVDITSSKNSILISNDSGEITQEDVKKVLYNADNFYLPGDKKIIDVIPRQFIVDGYEEIADPVGMVGTKLEVEADIVIGKITSVQNIIKSVERAGFKVDGIIVEGPASADMALTPDEKEIGGMLIDVGGGVADITVIKNKKVVYYGSVPVGGDHITNDVSMGIRIPFAEAERIKNDYELALVSLIKNDHEITVSEVNTNKRKNVRISEVVDIIEARVNEIFLLCREAAEKAGIRPEQLSSIVLTGRGISYLDGAVKLASDVFGIPVRIASYKSQGIKELEYVTAIALLNFITKQSKKNSKKDVKEDKLSKSGNRKKEKRSFVEKLSDFFRKFF